MKNENQAKLMRTTRVKAQFTQQDMATFLGNDSAQQISNIERGDCAIPQKHWKKFAQLCGEDTLLKALVADLKEEFRNTIKGEK